MIAATFTTATLLSVVLLLLNILEVCSLVLCSKKLTLICLLKNKKIDDEIHGNHYLAFIYQEKHKKYVQLLVKELEEYQNK